MRWLAALSLALCLAGTAQPARAADKPGPLRILLTFGGHGFEEQPFFAMFDALPGIKYTKAEMPKDAGLLKPGLQKDYDAIVMYDMVGGITPDQQQAFTDLLKQGIGVVSLHHNLGAHPKWDEFTKIIGGKFVFGDTVLEGKPYHASTWSHDELLKIKVADPAHPITQGIQDFEIHDETYGGYYTASDAHVLLTTKHPKNSPDIAWTKTYGKSRVFYLMLGHDSKAWANPNYPQLLGQGIRWVVAP
jgi:type 1 glutamine amidotransferase